MRQLQRNKRAEVASSIADAAGKATAVIPVPPGPTWEIQQIGVTFTGTLIPVCTTYVGTNEFGVFISQTLIGNSDTDSQPRTSLRSGESVAAVWTGATVGAQGRLTVIYDEVGY